MKKPLLYLFFVLLIIFAEKPSFACDSCSCSLARVSSEGKLSQNRKKTVFFDFTFEQQVWHKRDVALAHQLGLEGHDTHDKTTEEFYHFGLGANLGERFSFLAEIPYIVRHALNVEGEETEDSADSGDSEDDEDSGDSEISGPQPLPAHVGDRQTSQGFGDLTLTGIFKLLKRGDNFIGPLAGIKFPTGVTTNKTPQGEKYEPEMQPGSGSFDTSLGTAFQYQMWRIFLHGNVIYTIRTKGAQEFRFGNLFSTYIYADYLLNPKSKYFKSKVGIDTSLQNEGKQRSRGERVYDSGGTTWLLGPEFSIQGNEYISIFGNILFPVYQNLGGVHQQIRYVWNTGVKVAF